MKKITASRITFFLIILSLITVVFLFPFVIDIFVLSLKAGDYLASVLFFIPVAFFVFFTIVVILGARQYACIYWVSEDYKILYRKGIFGKQKSIQLDDIAQIYEFSAIYAMPYYVFIDKNFIKSEKIDYKNTFIIYCDKQLNIFLWKILEQNPQIEFISTNAATWDTFVFMKKKINSLVKKSQSKNIPIEVIYVNSENMEEKPGNINMIEEVFVKVCLNNTYINELIYKVERHYCLDGQCDRLFKKTKGFKKIKKLIGR